MRGEMVRRQVPRLYALNEFLKTPQATQVYKQNPQAFKRTVSKIMGPSPTKVGIAAGLATTGALVGATALEKRLRERQRRKQMPLR